MGWLSASATTARRGLSLQSSQSASRPLIRVLSFLEHSERPDDESRTRHPQAPAGTGESPHRQGRKALLPAGIPADPRSARKRHDRPVTPEVAGSSPVAPAEVFSCKSEGP